MADDYHEYDYVLPHNTHTKECVEQQYCGHESDDEMLCKESDQKVIDLFNKKERQESDESDSNESNELNDLMRECVNCGAQKTSQWRTNGADIICAMRAVFTRNTTERTDRPLMPAFRGREMFSFLLIHLLLIIYIFH